MISGAGTASESVADGTGEMPEEMPLTGGLPSATDEALFPVGLTSFARAITDVETIAAARIYAVILLVELFIFCVLLCVLKHFILFEFFEYKKQLHGSKKTKKQRKKKNTK